LCSVSHQGLQRGGGRVRRMRAQVRCQRGRGRPGDRPAREARRAIQRGAPRIQTEEWCPMSLHVFTGWTIRRRILVSFGVVLGLMVVMGLLALRDLDNIGVRASNAENASVPGLYYSTEAKD